VATDVCYVTGKRKSIKCRALKLALNTALHEIPISLPLPSGRSPRQVHLTIYKNLPVEWLTYPSSKRQVSCLHWRLQISSTGSDLVFTNHFWLVVSIHPTRKVSLQARAYIWHLLIWRDLDHATSLSANICRENFELQQWTSYDILRAIYSIKWFMIICGCFC